MFFIKEGYYAFEYLKHGYKIKMMMFILIMCRFSGKIFTRLKVLR